MKKFDTLIQELERADREIKDVSEENKKLKLELQYYQNQCEEYKKYKHEAEREMNLLKKETKHFMEKYFKLEDDLEEFLGGGTSVKSE